jgi:hypothetical protein
MLIVLRTFLVFVASISQIKMRTQVRLSQTGDHVRRPKFKMGLQHNNYSLQYNTYMEDLF